MKQKINSTNGGKDEETYKDDDLFEEEKIDKEISVKGAESLTNQELLAVILSGDTEALTAVNLLHIFDGNLVHLFCASINQLMEIEGIGSQEAQRIKATFELTKRIAAYCEEKHPKIASKDDVTKLLAPHMMFLPQEEFRVMLLDAKQKLIRVETVSLGSLDKPIDYHTQDFVEIIQNEEPDGLDAVFDGMGGDYLTRGFSLLKRHGTLVEYGNPLSLSSMVNLLGKVILLNVLPNGKSVKLYGTGASRFNKRPFLEDWLTLFTLLEEGKITPVIMKKFPILEAAKANALLESGKVIGNIVLVAPELLSHY